LTYLEAFARQVHAAIVVNGNRGLGFRCRFSRLALAMRKYKAQVTGSETGAKSNEGNNDCR
jgi:hypothetical protein